MDKKEPVVITALGEFSIAYGNNIIAEKDKRSKKMWTMLKYLTAFMDRNVTQTELIEILWDGENVQNPTGALKTQLHRLRTTLSVLEIPAKTELVLSFAGVYAFNDKLEYVVDALQFEKNYKQSQRADISEKEQILYTKKAFEMYGGAFLKNSGEEKWVVPLRVHYHSIYVRVVHKLTDALYTHKKYAELINICRKALLIEPADQKTHMFLIKALIAEGDRDAAKKHYKYVIDKLYNELGVNPLPELKELYRETADKNALYEDNLEIVQMKLREDNSETAGGAFFCEPETFKSIYRLKMRDSKRTGQKVQICLITVSDRNGGEIESKSIVKEMKRLHNCVSASLRRSDAFARYSLSQYVLMLPSLAGDAGEVVVGRITKCYEKKNTGFQLDINYKHVIAT